jgi:hypothetical protein
MKTTYTGPESGVMTFEMKPKVTMARRMEIWTAWDKFRAETKHDYTWEQLDEFKRKYPEFNLGGVEKRGIKATEKY